jgi:hypothetical protein
LAAAGDKAVRHIVQRLRQRKVAVSTADLVALQFTLKGLSQLRGHPVALRSDILDALQSALVKEALDAPPPWLVQGLLTPQHHPVLREALLALTGDGGGQLHADTPLPPLLHDVAAQLTACGIKPTPAPQSLVLDRRREADTPTAQTLWQLRLLGVEGVKLTDTRAPNAARGLRAEWRFQEHWSLAQDQHWFPNLIEAAAYGATLTAAARNRLLEQIAAAQGDAASIAQCLLHAIRAGLLDIGEALAAELQANIGQAHDHAALANAAQVLLEMATAGFWGVATRDVLEGVLIVIAERILWLLDGHQASNAAQIVGDVQAVRVFDGLLRLFPPVDLLEQNDFVSEQSDFVPKQNGSVPEQNGFAPEQNHFASEQSDVVPKQNGFEPVQNHFASEQSDVVPKQNGSLPEQNDFVPAQNHSASEPTGSAPKQTPLVSEPDDSAGFDAAFTLETLLRFARSTDKPPALRGAALAVAYCHDALGADAATQIILITRAIPPREQLGDFLYGLFACARALAVESDSIVQAIHAALETMSSEDFLVALPSLRNAFTWFPPRERGALAAHVAELLGLSRREQAQLLSLQHGATALVDAKRVEAQALAWANEFGVLR